MEKNIHISESLQALKRALALTGSFANLSRNCGISKMTLLKIGKGMHKPTIATKLRLQNFVEVNESRRGRPLKKISTNQPSFGIALEILKAGES